LNDWSISLPEHRIQKYKKRRRTKEQGSQQFETADVNHP
jgi:hypothetical protein